MTKPAVLPWLPCWAAGLLLALVLPVGGALYWLAVAALSALAWGLRRRPWLLCLPAVFLGCAYGVWRAEAALEKQWPLPVETKQVPLTVTVLETPQQDERRARFMALAQSADGRQYRLQLADYQQREWQPGSRWQTTARVRPVLGEMNAVGFNREAWALANGIDGSGILAAASCRPKSALASGIGRLPTWQCAYACLESG